MIHAIRSGGQTGVDRGALDAARTAGVPVHGWCPAGGWAEDCPHAPGLLDDYPELRETPSAATGQRTEWNVRDSHVTVIVTPGGADAAHSPGTALTVELAEKYGRTCMVTDGTDPDAVREWIADQHSSSGGGLEVNVAGPRASEWSRGYETSARVVRALLQST